MNRPKRFLYADGTVAAGSQVNMVNDQLAESVNIHGLRVKVSLFIPELGGAILTPAEAFVNLAVMCIPEIVSTIPDITNANFNSSALQDFIWATEKCLVTNLHTVECNIMPNTSRSCPAGSRFVIAIRETLAQNAVDATVSVVWWESAI